MTNEIILKEKSNVEILQESRIRTRIGFNTLESKKVKKLIFFLLPIFISFFFLDRANATGVEVYKNGKKLSNFFEANTTPLKPGIEESTRFEPKSLILIFALINILRESRAKKELLVYLQTEQLNRLKQKELLISLLVQGGEIAQSVMMVSCFASIMGLLLSIYLGQKEEMKTHFRSIGKKQIQVFAFELLVILSSIVAKDTKRIGRFFTNPKIGISSDFFLNYFPRKVLLLLILILLIKYSKQISFKLLDIWEDLPRINTLVNEFITKLYDGGDWTYDLRIKKIRLLILRLRRVLLLEKAHPPINWEERKYTYALREARVKDYESLLRRKLVGRLKLWWLMFQENPTLKTSLSDLEWFFVLFLLYNSEE